MAGIYIHIPFCSKACHYCDFHFSTSLALKGDMVKALVKELEQRSGYVTGEISTIYFGGGTPSLLEYQELKSILDSIYSLFRVSESCEITLEANPDDLVPSKLTELKNAGINRLSIGIQSFFEEDLVFLNRSHSSSQAIRCVQDARDAGFRNISIDLIFALPGKDDSWLRSNIEQALKLDPEHISCYGLTVEPRTVLASWVRKGTVVPASDSTFTSQYTILMHMLKEHGYEQYEISNFCKPGYQSKHNTSYWKGDTYLGIGPGSHSYNGDSRRWNIRNNHQYVKAINEGNEYFEEEELTLTDRINEYILTSLRTSTGTDLDVLESLAGPVFPGIMVEAEPHIANGHLKISENTLLLTEKGKFLCDKITSDLFTTNVRTNNPQDR